MTSHDFRSPIDEVDNFSSQEISREFSSSREISAWQEISLAATDGSGTTTLGDAADIDDDDDDDDDDEAVFGWLHSPRRTLAVHSAPPPDASQSLACGSRLVVVVIRVVVVTD